MLSIDLHWTLRLTKPLSDATDDAARAFMWEKLFLKGELYHVWTRGFGCVALARAFRNFSLDHFDPEAWNSFQSFWDLLGNSHETVHRLDSLLEKVCQHWSRNALLLWSEW